MLGTDSEACLAGMEQSGHMLSTAAHGLLCAGSARTSHFRRYRGGTVHHQIVYVGWPHDAVLQYSKSYLGFICTDGAREGNYGSQALVAGLRRRGTQIPSVGYVCTIMYVCRA